MVREHNAGHITPYHNVMIKFQFSLKTLWDIIYKSTDYIVNNTVG